MMDLPTPAPEQLALLRQQAEELAGQWRQGAQEVKTYSESLSLCHAKHERLARGLGDICDHTAHDQRWQSQAAVDVLGGLAAAAGRVENAAKAAERVEAAIEPLGEQFTKSAHAVESATDLELQEVIDQETRHVESAKTEATNVIHSARRSLTNESVSISKPWEGWDGVVHAFGTPPQA